MDMPGRNGLEVLGVLSAWQLERRVIMISGTPPDHTSAGKPKVAGFEIAAILVKPARKVEIESALAAALDLRDERPTLRLENSCPRLD
jgi:hypothetical protein